MPPCSVCAAPTTKRCSRCKAIPLCSPECMKSVWQKHKPDCNNVVAARQTSEEVGYQFHDQGIPSMMTGQDFLAANNISMSVYEKHGVTGDLPTKGSTMDSKKKIDFFLDFLDVHDSSSEKNAEAALPLKLFLNRRYNNCMKHAQEHFTENEFRQLLEQVKERRIGAANK